jgi:hypothetical protein
MAIEHDPDVRIEREGAVVRHVLYLSRTFQSDAVHSAVELAKLYLKDQASLFGLDPLSRPAGPAPPAQPFWTSLRRRLRAVPVLGRLFGPSLGAGIQIGQDPTVITIRNGQSFAVIFPQIQRQDIGSVELPFVDLPLWGAGIRVMVASAPLRVTAVASTLRPEVPRARVSRRFPPTAEAAAHEFHIPPEAVHGLFVHENPAAGDRGIEALTPTLVYARMDDPLLGGHTEGRALPYREHLDLLSGTVFQRDVLASHAGPVTGLAFTVDPRSQTAQPEPGPYRPADELDLYRTSHHLRNLTAGNPQQLGGARVYVAQDNPLGIAPPSRPAGASFDFTSRCNDFGAVSAYVHGDAAFRMVEALGFPAAEYFAPNVAAGQWPMRLVHRAPIRPGRAAFDGRTVNAQVAADVQPGVVREFRFAFGDLSDVDAPLGIAADTRFVWHEHCHALLIAATTSPEFGFAHSAGDALAAIICDLDSQIQAWPWRGVTFPWVEALRRHDRLAVDGWAWHGSLYSEKRDIRDPGGYRGEQILSSTLFRLFQTLGGDATLVGGVPDLVVRRAAAAYTVYLIVRVIRALGPVGSVPTTTPYIFAGALMDADISTPFLLPDPDVFRPFRARVRRGGAVHKVVRWSFECQGLWAPGLGAQTWNGRGEPEAYDVYIEDGRQGEYGYTAQWQAVPPHLRVAAQPNVNDPDAPPHSNTTGFVFVRVYNRGANPTPVDPATMRVFVARAPGIARRWRLAPGFANPWVELAPHAGAVTSAVVPRGASIEFGPFEWRPVALGGHDVLACVDAPGDRCNALEPTYACAVGPTRLAHLVPFDNNIAYRRIVVVP